MLRPLLWISVFLAAVTLVLVPAVYLYTSALLPTLETEFDLLRLLKLQTESERRSVRMGRYERNKDPLTFDRPDIVNLPKDLVAFYITERGCPTYFQSPREEGWPWAKRLMGVFFNKQFEGDGWCEKVFADNLSWRIGARGSLQLVVATHKIHRFLKKDQLVAYDLASMKIEEGIIGVEDASKALLKRKLSDLTLAELAEFTLAIPPHGYWEQIMACNNPNIIRKNRDILIGHLVMVGMISEEKAGAAVQNPVACLTVDKQK